MGESRDEQGYVVDCWCEAERHDLDHPKNPHEVVRNLWHIVIKEMRIPELADWIQRRLS